MKSSREIPRQRVLPRWYRKISVLGPLELYGLFAVVFLLVLAVIGPYIAPYPTETPDPTSRLIAPSKEHLLGTDENGMDVLSRILAAPRVDVSVAFIGIAIAVIVGTPIGVFAGYFEGSDKRIAALAGETTLRVMDAVQAFPVFVLAMVLVAVRGATTENIIIAIAFVNMPTFLRISRAEILSLRQRTYTEAARSIGAKDTSIAYRHLLPNAMPPLLAQVSVTMGFAILLTAGLSFVGAGVQPPTPELGGMISSGARMMIIGHWWPSLFPGIALGIIVFSFAAAGQALGRLFAPVSADAEGSAAREGDEQNPILVADEVKSHVNQTVPSHQTLNSVDSPATRLDESAILLDHGAEKPEECILVVDNLSVEFVSAGERTRVLSNISLWVAPGETFGIVGESGSGKSVLIRSILGLLPDGGEVVEGSVFFKDYSILEMDSDELRKIRGVEISPILPNAKDQLSPVTKISDLLVSVYRAHEKVDRKEALEKVIEALQLVGIQDPERRLSAYPHELSGGMAQRVCIALSLLHSPQLVIADEPTSGLDVTVQRQVLDLMMSATKERIAAQLIVTRDLGIVAQYCKRFAVMQGGRIVEMGYTEEVFRSPQHPYTRELIEAVSDVDASNVASEVAI